MSTQNGNGEPVPAPTPGPTPGPGPAPKPWDPDKRGGLPGWVAPVVALVVVGGVVSVVLGTRKGKGKRRKS